MQRALYFIAVIPPKALREEVRELKQQIQRRFGAGHALKSPAHITLQMPFRLEEDQQDTLSALLRNFAAAQSGFFTELNGFDCFPPRVIFLRVLDHLPFIPLQRDLNAALIASGVLPKAIANRPFHPHMTIATRDLVPEAFEKAWPLYRDRSFDSRFQVQSIFLLKHNGKHWDVFREFGFKGQ